MSELCDRYAVFVLCQNLEGKNRPQSACVGVTVRRIAIWYKQGLRAEEIAARIGHLCIAQVYAALTYYHINREEIDNDIAEEEAEADRIESLHRASRQP